MMNYAHRIESRNVVHTYALARVFCNSYVLPDHPEFHFQHEPAPIWRTGSQYTDPEILSLVDQCLTDIEAELVHRVVYSHDLRLVNGDTPTETLPRTVKFRGGLMLYLRALQSGDFTFTFSPASSGVSGTLLTMPEQTEITSFSHIAPDSVQTLSLQAGQLYLLDFTHSTGTNCKVVVPAGLGAAIEASEAHPAYFEYSGGYLFVPAYTKHIDCDAPVRLRLISPSGVLTDVSAATRGPEGYTSVPVPTGDAGKIWNVSSQTRGSFKILNIPPLVNLNRAHLLLPREVCPPVTLVPGDTPTETLPNATKFRGNLRIYLTPIQSGQFTLTFSPPTGYTIGGYLTCHRTGAELSTFNFTTSSTMTVDLEAGYLYRLDLSTHTSYTATVDFPAGLAVALEASQSCPAWLDYDDGYLFVPAGTTDISCYGSPRLSLKSPTGVRTDIVGAGSVPVPAGQDNATWTVYSQTRGTIWFVNVPPFVNLNRAHLLLSPDDSVSLK